MNGSNNLMRIVLIMNIVLVAAVCLLGAKEFMNDSPRAYASGGAATGKYIAVPIQYDVNREVLAVIDTTSDSIILYGVDRQGEVVYPTAGRTMDQDFNYLLKSAPDKKKDTFFSGVGPNQRGWTPAEIRQAITALGGQ